ncbi:transposase, partial [Mesotoga sp. UBA5825]|uniref:transposase n=1 Tax=Mesotoga sp. UBA5825 TaxID=1946858 RepID=UPI0025D4AB74
QIQKEERKIMIQDARVRNAVEGKIGEGKRKYGLGLIRGKLKETSETMIAFAMIAMNLARWLRGLFFSFFRWLFWGEIGGIRSNFEGVLRQNPHIVSQLLLS